jgi:multiple sugar transport system substrate-binding protein
LRKLRAVETVLPAAAMLALSLVSLFGCAKKQTGEVITFWQFFDSEAIRPLLVRFEQAHPGVRVEMQQLTWQSGREKIIAAVAAGEPPDLCELGSTWVAKFASDGALLERTSQTADLRDGYRMWETAEYEGRVYGLPWVLGTRALFVNLALFERARVDSLPRTWQGLLEASKKVDGLGSDVYGFGLNSGERYVLYKKFMPFAWGNGGAVLSEDMSRSVFDSRQNLEALRFLTTLRASSLLEKQDVLDRSFIEGRVGIVLSGAWLLRTLEKEAPSLRYAVTLVPRPDAGGTHASFAGAEVLVSFRGSKHPQGALELARFLMQKENAVALARAVRSVQPAAVGAEDDPYYREHEADRVFIEQLRTAVGTPPHARWAEIEDIVNESLEEALHGSKSPEEALREGSKRIEALLASSS